MAFIWSDYKQGYIDLDKEEEYEPCDIIYEFSNTDDFRDNLYDSCNFGVEWDDFRKWDVIEDAPGAEKFEKELIEYAQEQLNRELTKLEKEELIKEWNKHYDNIFADLEENLLERHNDQYDGE